LINSESNACDPALKNLKMKKLIILLLHSLILVPFIGAAQNTTIQFFPMSVEGTMPCTGEEILFEGQYIWIRHTTLAKSNYSGFYSIHFQGISATNTTTGEKYIYAGTLKNKGAISFDNGRWISKNIMQVNLVGTGKAINYTVHMVVSTTYDANGELRADIDEVRIECR
jgi:hypothetical protein